MKKIILWIIGIIAIALGIFVISNGNKMEKECSVETEATVVEIREKTSTDSDGDTIYEYYPQLEYIAGEETISVKGSSSSNSSRYKVGDKIAIQYNPNNVKEYIVKGDNSSRIAGIIWIVIGVFIILAGIKNLIIGR